MELGEYGQKNLNEKHLHIQVSSGKALARSFSQEVLEYSFLLPTVDGCLQRTAPRCECETDFLNVRSAERLPR